MRHIHHVVIFILLDFSPDVYTAIEDNDFLGPVIDKGMINVLCLLSCWTPKEFLKLSIAHA